VANYSCLALRNLTCFKENTVKALSLGALDALIDVLQMHANNALVQEASACALQNLTDDPGDVLSRHPNEAVARALQALLAALPGHAANEKVHAPLLGVLGNLAWHNMDRQNMAAAAGAIQDAVAALRSPATAAVVRSESCYVLDVLAHKNAGAQVAAYSAGAVEALLPMLRLPLPDVLRSACWALASIAGNTAAAARAGELGAVEAVLTALRAHQSNACLQAGGCCALYFLAQGCAANMSKAHRAGAAAAAQAALAAHAADTELQAEATALLQLLQQSTAAADAAMAALLAAEAAERAPLKKRKSKKKHGGGGGAAAAAPQKDEAAAASGGNAAGGAGSAAQPLAHGQDADDTAVALDASPAAEPADAVEQGGGVHSPAEQHGVCSAADAVECGDNRSDGSAGGSAEPPPAFGYNADAQPPQPLVQPAVAAPRRAPRPYRPPVGGASPCAPLAALQPPPAMLSPAAGAALLPPYMSALALALGAQPQAPAPLAAAACAACARSRVDASTSTSPPPPELLECCVCFADVTLEELLLLYPCGHRCVCQACADALVAIAPPAERLCPSCRKDVLGATRVFTV
jgi:hypothetical protein